MKIKVKKEWIIESSSEYDDETGELLCWNNEDGWVSPDCATVFTDYEMETFDFIPEGGRWVLA